MLDGLKAKWRRLRESEPGARFQDRYYRARRRGQSRLSIWLVARVASAAALIAIGLGLLVLPGPGVLALAAGGAILASDFLVVARFFDCAEVQVRRAIRWLRRWWNG